MTEFIGTGRCGASFDPVLSSYRYTLWRRWWFEFDCRDDQLVAFCGLNPSTADATLDDPTVRRCIGFAKQFGAPGMVMLNLFAYRATDPRQMKLQYDPVGVLNNDALRDVAQRCRMVVACWGNHGRYRDRERDVVELLRRSSSGRLYHLGLTRSGAPRHPLYLPSGTKLMLW